MSDLYIGSDTRGCRSRTRVISTRSTNRLRAAIARATRGRVATPGILERVNLDDDRRLRARCRRD
eukprot:3137961-Prymnesium_polylepis.1